MVLIEERLWELVHISLKDITVVHLLRHQFKQRATQLAGLTEVSSVRMPHINHTRATELGRSSPRRKNDTCSSCHIFLHLFTMGLSN